MEEQCQEPLAPVQSAEQRLAQPRRRQRLLRPAPAGEVREVVVGVEQLPAERQRGDAAALNARGRRAVREAELAQQPRRRRGQLPARRAEAARLEAQRPHPVDAPPQPVALRRGIERRPALVAPAVAGDLVPALPELAKGVRVELRVEPLDEERRAQAGVVERREHARQRLGHRVVRPERLVLGPPAALEVARLPEVVEGDADVHSAATVFSSRPTRSISTTIRSPSRSSTFGSRR